MSNTPLEISNLSTFDPFADAAGTTVISGEKVHLRCQQRNGRKCITTVQGLSTDLELKKILRRFKKTFNCNGAMVNDKELGDILQLSGDQREGVRKFLVDNEIYTNTEITVHGF
jgi:translation initiation factor 1